LLPEIKAYIAKARLRRGIEIVKLANRIEALKMQEDDDTPGQSDVPADAKAAATTALGPDPQGNKPEAKRSLSNIAKGAIFREVVLAKVREAKEAENALQVEKDAQDKAASKRHSSSGN